MLAGFSGVFFLGNIASAEDGMTLSSNIPVPEGTALDTRVNGHLALCAAVPPQIGCSGINAVRSEEHLVFAASGTLYNKNELAGKLAIDPLSSDIDLMCQSWLKWGVDAVLHLDGDWMFAAYDDKSSKLMLARSWGQSSLYYYKGKDFFAFATHPAALVRLPGVPNEPDTGYIIKMLCSLPLEANSSAYKDIRQLEPASVMEVTRDNLHKSTWWRPSHVKETKITEEEALERFLTIYNSAVARRLATSGKVGATLSSGLDSSSVCVLAANELKQYGKTLTTLTSVPYYKEDTCNFGRWIADEGTLAGELAQNIGNVQSLMVNSKDEDPINALRLHIVRTGRPQGAGANLYWINDILKTAAGTGCSVLLIGQYGNSTISWTPRKIVLFPKSLFFPETSLIRYAGYLKKRMHKRFYAEIRRVRYGRTPVPPVINPEFVRSGIIKDYFKEACARAPKHHADLVEEHMGISDTWYHNSFWSGIEVRDPTMDTCLTEFVLSLPDNYFFRDGMDRRLIRLGMKGLLPDKIRLNRLRGQQASDIVQRVRSFSAGAERALEYMEKSSLAVAVLAVGNIRRMLERICAGENDPESMKDCSGILFSGLSAGLFLASFDTDLDLRAPL